MDRADLPKLLTPDRCQVLLMSCTAGFPISFARHPWFVINRFGALSRWEVFLRPRQSPTSWGHLSLDYYGPFEEIEKTYALERRLDTVRLEGSIEGPLAQRVADFIEESPAAYPHCYNYALRGPNSNTYAQWVINKFPDSNFTLPWNAFGKNYIM